MFRPDTLNGLQSSARRARIVFLQVAELDPTYKAAADYLEAADRQVDLLVDTIGGLVDMADRIVEARK